tara:strand:+ start:166 stop:597 length:432 start_codon:yes stop_codon:yes gene_type:complete
MTINTYSSLRGGGELATNLAFEIMSSNMKGGKKRRKYTKKRSKKKYSKKKNSKKRSKKKGSGISGSRLKSRKDNLKETGLWKEINDKLILASGDLDNKFVDERIFMKDKKLINERIKQCEYEKMLLENEIDYLKNRITKASYI